MDEKDFLFSLYHKDLIRIKNAEGITLNAEKGVIGEKQILRQDGFFYFDGADSSDGRISFFTHDHRYKGRKGIKSLQSIEKYQVDVLGNYYKVGLPEKRMKFSKED